MFHGVFTTDKMIREQTEDARNSVRAGTDKMAWHKYILRYYGSLSLGMKD